MGFPSNPAFVDDPNFGTENYGAPSIASDSGAGTDPYFGTENYGIAPSTGGAASNSSVQSSSPGSNLLGWLGLGASVAQTVVNANRPNYRVGTVRGPTMGVGTTGGLTLLLIVAAFVGVIFLLRK
jgi:hypothetical protein